MINHPCVCLLFAVPCVPTNVSVVMDCANNTAVVSWSASRGAVQYLVSAYGGQVNGTCQTSGLSCNLASLTCGSHYAVYVVAMGDNCSSIPSQAVMYSSGNRCNTYKQKRMKVWSLVWSQMTHTQTWREFSWLWHYSSHLNLETLRIHSNSTVN